MSSILEHTYSSNSDEIVGFGGKIEIRNIKNAKITFLYTYSSDFWQRSQAHNCEKRPKL